MGARAPICHKKLGPRSIDKMHHHMERYIRILGMGVIALDAGHPANEDVYSELLPWTMMAIIHIAQPRSLSPAHNDDESISSGTT
jgi:hypothetical protein